MPTLRVWNFLLVLIMLLGVGRTAAAAQDPAADAARNRRRTPVVDVFEKCHDAVVNVATTRIVRVRSPFGGFPFEDFFELPRARQQRVSSVGSGFIIHSRGYIVTNYHVVAQTTDVQVGLSDNTVLPAQVIAADPDHDLAVLKIEPPRELPALPLGRSDDLMVGETVVAIGNPLGLGQTVTAGIVSARDREIRVNDQIAYRGLIQTDTPINPGNSGGPLLDVNGELVGINTAIRGDAQNIGFAIPVSHLWSLLPSLLDIERRERVRVGLEVVGPSAEVVGVRDGSPAFKAGIRRGDRVVSFNAAPLHDGIDYYVRLLEQKPGAKMKLTLRRGDKSVDAVVPLEVVPPPDGAKLAQQMFGLKLRPIPESVRRDLAREFGSGLLSTVGLAVDGVERNSPAEEAEFERGEIILRVGRAPAPTLEDLGLFLEQVGPGEPVAFDVLTLRADAAYHWTAKLRARAPERR